MPRAPRINLAGGHYHVFQRGVRRSDIYRTDSDRRLFLSYLRNTCLVSDWRCLAYCLMTNHYHLVIRTNRPSLSSGMQWLNARYAEHFNLAYEHTGHVFQHRFGAKLIETHRYLLAAIRYVELNAVNAGLCRSASSWQWSSYSVVTGTRSHREWFDRSAVLALFGPDVDVAAVAYAKFIADDNTDTEYNATMRTRSERDAAIRSAHAQGGYTLRALAAAFAVSPATILRVVSSGSDPDETT